MPGGTSHQVYSSVYQDIQIAAQTSPFEHTFSYPILQHLKWTTWCQYVIYPNCVENPSELTPDEAPGPPEPLDA